MNMAQSDTVRVHSLTLRTVNVYSDTMSRFSVVLFRTVHKAYKGHTLSFHDLLRPSNNALQIFYFYYGTFQRTADVQ